MTIISELKELFSLYEMFLIVAIGLFTFFVDFQRLRKRRLRKDARIAKGIGLVYLIVGPLIFISLQFV
ncbi:CLC_0170 family protein [Caldisalinibacter kiritimatiensis]|uniref:Uncharacterized protein n=1 Tax=Caldisalinibacter kiritimatiensis TaxID=1304284 RepID=R1AYC1_9FIRM|nr:CLC_0170 family protein [Caldisalinibacter kiritimatiensis]EOD01687.1 hypothetical protein L21TH_0228 [Caldisalinibacter kiritimatiensis]